METFPKSRGPSQTFSANRENSWDELKGKETEVTGLKELIQFDRGNIFASLTRWGAHLLVKWGQLENGR